MSAASRTIFLFERGILGYQSIFGDWDQWPNWACAWVNNNTEDRAQTLPYFSGPFRAAASRPRRAQNFAAMLKAYQGWNLRVVAHSEGTATVLAALKLADYPVLDRLHLICGACNSDCDLNGINYAMGKGRIGRLVCDVAGQDKAMRLEDNWVGCICFGLQTGGTPMGLDGPKNMTTGTTMLTTIPRWPTFGHSTCWDKSEFENTMKLITA